MLVKGEIMEDIKHRTLKELIDRLNNIDKIRKDLDQEESEIVYEIWERIPSLKDNELFHPKVFKKENNNGKVFK